MDFDLLVWVLHTRFRCPLQSLDGRLKIVDDSELPLLEFLHLLLMLASNRDAIFLSGQFLLLHLHEAIDLALEVFKHCKKGLR